MLQLTRACYSLLSSSATTHTTTAHNPTALPAQRNLLLASLVFSSTSLAFCGSHHNELQGTAHCLLLFLRYKLVKLIMTSPTKLVWCDCQAFCLGMDTEVTPQARKAHYTNLTQPACPLSAASTPSHQAADNRACTGPQSLPSPSSVKVTAVTSQKEGREGDESTLRRPRGKVETGGALAGWGSWIKRRVSSLFP